MQRIYDYIIEDHLKNYSQMIFLIGARQVGKTTISKNCKNYANNYVYLNWDYDDDQLQILRGAEDIVKRYNLLSVAEEKNTLALDEIHKYREWRNYVKGFYDKHKDFVNFIITGSAKLDAFRTGGDSMMGRYFPYQIHPFSISELVNTRRGREEIIPPKEIERDIYKNLLEFGGFPEPLLKGEKEFHRRWIKLRSQQLFQQDIRDMTRIQEIAQLKLLSVLLKEQAGQLVNYSNLAQKVKVMNDTVQKWIKTLSAFYYCFEVRPWTRNITRSLIKQPKIYLNDWSEVDDRGAKYENFVACHLKKAIDYWNDTGLGDYRLYFLRDKEKREVDFLVTKEQEPWFLVEVKSSYKEGVSKNLRYFHEQTKAKHAFQVVFDLEYVDKDCFSYNQPVIVPATTFLSQLV